MSWPEPPRAYKGPEGDPVKMGAENMVNPNPRPQDSPDYPSVVAMDWLRAQAFFGNPEAREILLYVYGFKR